jgi:pimeloyl-ACP methyl ester carboxylesterase
MSKKRVSQHSKAHSARAGRAALWLLAAILVSMWGCSTVIGTREVGFRTAYEQINTNALLNDTYSTTSKNVLHRYNLRKQFEKDPRKTLMSLHGKTREDDRRDLLFTLAELSYYTAGRTSKPRDAKAYYLSAAVYAYFYLFDETRDVPADPFDRKYRLACDLYNTALAQAMTAPDGGLAFKDGAYPLPAGSIAVSVKSHLSLVELKQFGKLLAADRLQVYGLSRRDRDAGLGVAFIAVEKRPTILPVKRSFAGTLFLRVEGGVRDVDTGTLRGSMELYSPMEHNEVKVNGKHVPLESDMSAQLAYTLNQPLLWDLGLKEFLTGKSPMKTGVYLTKPYRAGEIPVLFVHGTVSSPVWWAEMMNTLRADTILRRSCNFWFYFYDSGKPIKISAHQLREALTRKVAELDPGGTDRALMNMVVIGHSQGGLLVKLTATDTGERILRSMTGKGLDELDVTPAQREAIRRYVIYKHLPFVRRVVFISTPHRGSFLAKRWVRNLVRLLVSLPLEILEEIVDLGKALATAEIPWDWEWDRMERRTSLDSMSPDSRPLLALAEIPLAPGINGHSIVAIKGDGDPQKGDDGVVKYTSAHIDYVESEMIVRSGHSCQDHPKVIEEVRRILLEHLNEVKTKGVSR